MDSANGINGDASTVDSRGGGSVNCRNASKDDSLLGMRLNALNGHMGFLRLAKVLERSPIWVFSRGGGESRERSTFLHA